MSITFDNKSTTTQVFSSGFSAVQTIAYTVGAYSGHASMVVAIQSVSTNGLESQNQVASVTYNGVALTFKGRKSTSQGEGVENVELWALADPAAGTHDLVATLNNGPSGSLAGWICQIVTHLGAGVLSYSGFASSTTDVSPAAVTVVSTAGSLVIGSSMIVVDHSAAAPASVAGQTTRLNGSSGTGVGDIYGVTDEKTGGASVTVSWTVTAIHHANMVGISIDEAAVVASALARRASAPSGTRIGTRQA